MTDLSKLSIPELREKVEYPSFALNAFDELAERYRRLEQSMSTAPDVGVNVGAIGHGSVSSFDYSAAPIPPAPQSKSQYKRLVAQGAIPPSEVSKDTVRLFDAGTGREVKSVSEEDKELLRECNELMTLYGVHEDSREYHVAAALKRRILR